MSPHLGTAAGLLINAGLLVSNIAAAILQVSWLRHYPTTPIPQLLAVNNITNTLDPRTRAVVR